MELFPSYPGTFAFDWLSAILILIVAVFMLEGIIKGGAKTFLNQFGGLIVTILSFIAAMYLCNLLVDYDFANFIKDPVRDFFTGIGGDIMGEVHTRDEVLFVLTNGNYSFLKGVGIPDFVCPFIVSFLGSCIPETDVTLSVADYFARGVAALAIAIVVFIVVSIILSIILGAIKRAVRKRQKVKKPGFFSRLLGLIFGTAMGVVWALIVVWIFSFLGGVDFFRNFLDETWKLKDDGVLTIGEYLYKTNYVNMFITWVTSLFA